MKSRKGCRLLPSPAMVVAIVALIAALAGSAVALQGKNSVKGNDIAPGAVKGSKIAKGAVKGAKIANDAVNGSKVKNGSITAPDLDVYRNAAAAGPLTTASGPPVDLGGPSVTVTVPEGGLVNVYTRADLQATGGGNDGAAQVHLYEPTVLPDAPAIMTAPNGTSGFVTRYSAPGSADFGGVASAARGGMVTLSPPAGTYTFSLRYSGQGGATGTFQNAAIWAGVVN
jgi:hypothetical protein